MNQISESCRCHQQYLLIDRRKTSYMASYCLFMVMVIFTAGYFLGKKYGIEALIAYDNDLPQMVGDIDDACSQEVPMQESLPQLAEASSSESNSSAESEHAHYYAKLAGFGSEKVAQALVERLKLRGIETRVIKRISRPIGRKNKKTIYWYQVVTAPYSSEQDLMVIVDTIKTLEHIKSVQIVSNANKGFYDINA